MSEADHDSERVSSPQADYDQLSNVSVEVPCPYLPGLKFRSEAYQADGLDGATYERLLARGFRRSGGFVYRTRCQCCAECRQLRVLTDRFTPTRSMRRVWRLNGDVRVEITEPRPSPAKFNVYRRYLESQHDETMAREYGSFVDYLYTSPVKTLEFVYWLGQRLAGVSIVDCCPGGLSSVYMYFDPDFRARSLGTYSALWEIDYCRQQRMPYYYFGFFVAGSATMAYKARFRPNEVLVGDDRWISFRGKR